jgi:phage internal scaffolding protein
MTLRDAGNYDRKAESDRTAIPPGGPSLTVQSQSEDADINVLMKRFGVTGHFPENPRVPSYGDFSHITDFRSALLAIRAAEEAFAEYPADFRARFENNPQNFLMFCEDPANIDAMRQLGLLKAGVQNGPVVSGGGNSSGAQGGSASGAAPPQPGSAS